MLSTSFSMVEFLNKARSNSYQRVLTLANREATDAERFLYKKKGAVDGNTTVREYASCLKDFIFYIRYGIKTKKLRSLDLDPFEDLRQMKV